MCGPSFGSLGYSCCSPNHGLHPALMSSLEGVPPLRRLQDAKHVTRFLVMKRISCIACISLHKREQVSLRMTKTIYNVSLQTALEKLMEE
ncbi:hypothetical protein AAC387_Pa05g1512 [Persea americana]